MQQLLELTALVALGSLCAWLGMQPTIGRTWMSHRWMWRFHASCRFNLLAALAKRGITAAERAEMDALAAELEAAELARAGAPVGGAR